MPLKRYLQRQAVYLYLTSPFLPFRLRSPIFKYLFTTMTETKVKQLLTSTAKYNQTVWIIPLGITAFVISAFLLIGLRFTEKRFYEIGVDFKKIEMVAIDSIKVRLEKTQAEAQLLKTALVKIKSADTNRVNKKIDSITNLLQTLEIKRYELIYKNIDTLSLSTKYTVNRKTLADSIGTFKKGDSLPIRFGYYNTEFSREPVIVEGKMTTNYFNTSTDFFNRYPNFALWGFLWILQMVVWFIIAGICVSLYKKIKSLFMSEYKMTVYGFFASDRRISFRNR